MIYVTTEMIFSFSLLDTRFHGLKTQSRGITKIVFERLIVHQIKHYKNHEFPLMQ